MWLLEQSILLLFEQLMRAGIVPTAEQQAQLDARVNAAESGSRVLSVSKNVARINVVGVLTKAPDFLAQFFGGGNTTYAEIIDAIALAQSDDDIESMEMYVDSPGGQLAGLFEAMAAMRSATKPIKVIVSDLAASAAYGLASQGSEIVASNTAARFGSVGIAVEFFTNPNNVVITSSKAPNKRPDLTTDEGKAVVRAQLDDMHDEFVAAIAEGRNTTPERVNSDFGKGGLVMASEAVTRGMIDAVDGIAKLPAVTATQIDTKEPQAMDINELKAKHPDTYAAIFGQGREAGVNDERARVQAHLLLADGSGEIKAAHKAIADGTPSSDAVLVATHMSAAMKRGIQASHVADGSETGAADGAGAAGAATPTGKTKEQLEDEAAALLVGQHIGSGSEDKIVIDV